MTVEALENTERLTANGWPITNEGRILRLVTEFEFDEMELANVIGCGQHKVAKNVLVADSGIGKAPELGNQVSQQLRKVVTFCDGLMPDFKPNEIAEILRYNHIKGLEPYTPLESIAQKIKTSELESVPMQLVTARRNHA